MISSGPPFFSIILAAHDTPADLLRGAVGSVCNQTFHSWELIIVDDGSVTAEVPVVLEEVAAQDNRIRVVRRAINGGIVTATKDGMALARGTFLGFLDHDDLLDRFALEICAKALDENADCDLLYTDEDRVDRDGRRVLVFHKPDWSPERLRAQNYINHFSLYRRSLVEEVGGLRDGFDGSQDYDLTLRATEKARRIVHVPKVLYHWRLTPGQVSASGDPCVYAAARQAIAEHCERVGIDSAVEQINPVGVYRVRRKVRERPLVSIVIPTNGSAGEVWGEERTFVVAAVEDIIEKSTYPRYEIVVIADVDMPRKITDHLHSIAGDRLRLLWYQRPFNYSHKINVGVANATGDYLLLLNDDVEIITPDWIEALLGLAQEPDVGMVGAALLFEDGRIQHGGHFYPGPGDFAHIGYGCEADDPGPASALQLERECSGVTAACAMLSRDDYLQVGGLSRSLPFNFNDVDLSLKIRSLGRRIVWTPFARLYHFESRSRVADVRSTEIETIMRRWARVLDAPDPYWYREESEERIRHKIGSPSSPRPTSPTTRDR